MKKRMKSVISVLCMGILCLLFLTACKKTEKAFAYITVETNPAFEYVVDAENIVVAINGLNNDGKLVLCEEAIVGLPVEEAINRTIQLSFDMGFLIEGDVQLTNQTIHLSITSHSELVEQNLMEKLTKNLNRFLKNHKIAAKLAVLPAKTKAYLEEIVLSYHPGYTKEQVEQMDIKELLPIIELATIEKAEFLSTELETYYQELKRYEFDLYYQEQICNALNDSYQSLKSAYLLVLQECQAAMEQIKQFKQEALVNPDSLYVQATKALESYKNDGILLNLELSRKASTGESVTLLRLQIDANQTLYDASKSALEAAALHIQVSFDHLLGILEAGYQKLVNLEKQFPDQIPFDTYLSNAMDYINQNKALLFEKFEASISKTSLNALQSAIIERKNTLKAMVSEKMPHE